MCVCVCVCVCLLVCLFVCLFVCAAAVCVCVCVASQPFRWSFRWRVNGAGRGGAGRLGMCMLVPARAGGLFACVCASRLRVARCVGAGLRAPGPFGFQGRGTASLAPQRAVDAPRVRRVCDSTESTHGRRRVCTARAEACLHRPGGGVSAPQAGRRRVCTARAEACLHRRPGGGFSAPPSQCAGLRAPGPAWAITCVGVCARVCA